MTEEIKDVKIAAEASTEAKPVADSTVKPIETVEDRAIPYARFKEKNDEAKELKRQLEMAKSEREAAVNETAVKYQSFYEAELAKQKRAWEETNPGYTYAEPEHANVAKYDNEISFLKTKLNELQGKQELVELNGEIQKLKTIYPSMGDEHVLAVKKTKPQWTLDQCAEYSHQYFEGELKTRIQRMMDKQKKAVERPIMGEQGKINIKPEDRPKNFKDARAGVLAHLKLMGD